MSTPDPDQPVNTKISSFHEDLFQYLEKHPNDRTAEDIVALIELTQILKAFKTLPYRMRRDFCEVLNLAVIEKCGTIAIEDGEELDSWCVIIKGSVELIQAEESQILSVGDSFGVAPTKDKLYHRGILRTTCDNCQFICIAQYDYFKICQKYCDDTTYLSL